MFVCHKVSLKLGELPGNIQMACNGDLLALPFTHNAVAIWNLKDDSLEVRTALFILTLLSLDRVNGSIYF